MSIAKIVKKVKEMSVDIQKASSFEAPLCDAIAMGLYDEGYRKQSEVIDEFAEKLKQAPIRCAIPLLGLSTKEEIEEYFNGIMLQVRDAIDSIAKEMKGEGR